MKDPAGLLIELTQQPHFCRGASPFKFELEACMLPLETWIRSLSALF